MADGYQPLATYGALTDIPIEEARFRPGVTDDDLIRAGRLGAQYIQPADGFQSLVYLYDGQRHRVLAFWDDRDAIERFHLERRAELVEQESEDWPESPWITRLEEFRSGVARRQLMGPRMGLEQTDLATLTPPGVVVAHDVAGLTNVDPILDLWQELVPSSGPATIQQFRGFMFFTACDFGDGELSVYLAFRTPDDLAEFRTSDFNAEIQRRAMTVLHNQQATSSFHDGRLLAWTVRQLD